MNEGFLKAIDYRARTLARKYVEPVKAEVVEISGSTARVRFPGEDATTQRPFYPVIGAAPTVGQTVLVLANFAGGWIITSGGGGIVRVFPANNDYSTDIAFNAVAGSFVAMPYPSISVPALGTPPAGTAWRIDVVGQIRLLPPSQNVPNLHTVMFSTGNNSGIAGGKNWVANTQSMSPVAAYAMVADTLTQGFTVNFTMWSNVSAEWRVRTGRNPVARVYLVPA